MATSGSKSVTVTAQHTLKFSWSQVSQSIANNTTTISWKLELIAGNGNINSSASKTWSVTINGKKFSGSNTVGIAANKTITLASSADSGNVTITHSSDGSKSFSYSFSQQFSITYSGNSVGTVSGSGTGTLNTIPRASTVSATNAYIESASTITISRKSSSFKHTLQYKVGSGSYSTIVTKTSSTSYNWTLPDTIYALIPNSKTATITIKCITYNGDTQIGDAATCTLTATCKESLCKPYFFEPSVVDTNATTIALTGDSSVLVKYYSTALVHSNPHAENEATITDTSISDNVSTTVLNQVAEFSKVESGTFNLYAEDSRGFAATETLTATFINYLKVTCNLEVSPISTDGSGEIKISGNYLDVYFGKVLNELKLYLRMKENDGDWTDWVDVSEDLSLEYALRYEFIMPFSGLNYKSRYTFQAKAEDKLSSATSKQISVKTAPVFDWSSDDFQFNVPVYTEDGYSLTGLAKALSNTYTLDTEGTTAGTNWTINNFSVVMLGNIVRCQYDITRNPATGTGNIANETVINAKFKHSGKIKSLYTNPFASGGTGGIATYAITDAVNDGTYITMKINIAAVGTAAITQSTGAFLLPVVIDTTKY